MKTIMAAGVAGLMLVAAAAPAAADADRDLHVAGKIMKEFFVKPFVRGMVEPAFPLPPPPAVQCWPPQDAYVGPRYYYYPRTYVKPCPPQYVSPYWRHDYGYRQHDPGYRYHGDRGYAPRHDPRPDYKSGPHFDPKHGKVPDKGYDRGPGRGDESRYRLHK